MFEPEGFRWKFDSLGAAACNAVGERVSGREGGMMSEERSGRLLVLCVDRDNDVGEKIKVKTPVIGRDACVSLASHLAVSDPEEADANAIFAAVKLYDELLSRGYEAEVAAVAGLFERGVEADQKLRRETLEVVRRFDAEGMVVVTDGTEDEAVIPVLQSILPIVSVKRVVIRQSRGVEESYVILARYLRMAVYDPRYSKFFLGVPGSILLISGLLIYLRLFEQAAAVALGILGAALIMRGLEFDKAIASITKLKPSGYIRLFSMLASILIILSAFQQAFVAVAGTPEYIKVQVNPLLLMEYGPRLLGLFIQESMNYVWTGLAIYFGAGILYQMLRGSIKMVRNALGLILLVLLYLPIQQFSFILTGQATPFTLVTLLLMGLAITFVAVTAVYEYTLSKRSRVRRRK